ncbi:MAG: hypothetical protein HYT08_01775 [Candidatus Levybacteria bacterium]|nr:hypothetical protein [Candidatus Levybacteria bacterium]
MNRQEKINGSRRISVHDMPDFTAALEQYGEILKTTGVPPARAEACTMGIIDKASTKREEANRFINFVAKLSKEIQNGNGNHQEEVVVFSAKNGSGNGSA